MNSVVTPLKGAGFSLSWKLCWNYPHKSAKTAGRQWWPRCGWRSYSPFQGIHCALHSWNVAWLLSTTGRQVEGSHQNELRKSIISEQCVWYMPYNSHLAYFLAFHRQLPWLLWKGFNLLIALGLISFPKLFGDVSTTCFMCHWNIFLSFTKSCLYTFFFFI